MKKNTEMSKVGISKQIRENILLDEQHPFFRLVHEEGDLNLAVLLDDRNDGSVPSGLPFVDEEAEQFPSFLLARQDINRRPLDETGRLNVGEYQHGPYAEPAAVLRVNADAETVPLVGRYSLVVESAPGHVSGGLKENFRPARRHLKLEIVDYLNRRRVLTFDSL